MIVDSSPSVYKTPPMSGSIKTLTYIFAALPVVLVYTGITIHNGFLLLAVFFILLIAGVWLWMRPTHYEVTGRTLTIVWPLRRHVVLRSSIHRIRILDKTEIKKELGFAMRIGVGGLFGGFGLLWTRRRGLVRFYITRLDFFIMIDRRNDRPLLITVDNPQRMLKELETGG